MFGSIVLEVLIGLALVYLLLSLVCSTIQEAWASFWNWRGKMLRDAIARLLDEDPPSRTKGNAGPWTTRVYAHPLIQALHGQKTMLSRRKKERLPSYIPNPSFADAFVDLIVTQQAPNVPRAPTDKLVALLRALSEAAAGNGALASSKNLATTLSLLMERARQRVDTAAPDAAARTLEAFKQEVCSWYENTMNRATGWYRRRTQGAQFLIAAVTVLLANVDSVMVAEQLARDPKAREAAVNAATQYVAERTPATATEPVKEASGSTAPAGGGTPPTSTPAVAVEPAKATDAELVAKLQAVGPAIKQFVDVNSESQIRVGWPDPAWKHAEGQPPLERWSRLWWLRILRKVIGLAISICAVALGAPFWFQMLEKLVKLRGSGNRLVEGASATPPAAGGSPDAAQAISTTVVSSPGSGSGGTSVTSVSAVASNVSSARGDEKLDELYWSKLGQRWRQLGRKQLPPDGDAKADKELAVFLARMSALAYEQEWTIEARLKELDAITPDTFEFFDAQGTQAFAVRIGKDAIVAYRGTQPAQIEDVVADARAALRAQAGVTGKVHMGFAGALDAVRAKVDAWLARHAADAERVFVTGHSLGAALATLHFARSAGAEASFRMQLVTFGSPRVGDKVFCDEFEKRTQSKKGALRKTRVLRFVNNRDLVTRVAPRNMGFEHVGAECYIDSDGKVLTDEKGAEKWVDFLLLVVDGVAEFRAAAKKPIGDHSMDLYVRRLENWTGWSA